MTKTRINYLGFLSLLSLVAILGYTSGNRGLYGFLGFLVYLRYFWVIPDELFLLNLRKAATLGFLTQLIALAPILLAAAARWEISEAISVSLALSLALGIVLFSAALAVLQWKELEDVRGD